MQVFSKYDSTLGSTGRAHSPLLTGKRYDNRVLAAFTLGSRYSMGKDSAIKVSINLKGAVGRWIPPDRILISPLKTGCLGQG